MQIVATEKEPSAMRHPVIAREDTLIGRPSKMLKRPRGQPFSYHWLVGELTNGSGDAMAVGARIPAASKS